MCEALKVPITVINEAHIDSSITQWNVSRSINLNMHHGGGLLEEVKVFKDILQRIIFPARFEDAMPDECEIICIWYEGTKTTDTYVVFDGKYPKPDIIAVRLPIMNNSRSVLDHTTKQPYYSPTIT